jgi:hypothetical protein
MVQGRHAIDNHFLTGGSAAAVLGALSNPSNIDYLILDRMMGFGSLPPNSDLHVTLPISYKHSEVSCRNASRSIFCKLNPKYDPNPPAPMFWRGR